MEKLFENVTIEKEEVAVDIYYLIYQNKKGKITNIEKIEGVE